MKLRTGQFAAAIWAGALAGAALPGSQALAAASSTDRVILHPGEDAADAVRSQSIAAIGARLRAAWVKAGHAATPAQGGQTLAITGGTVLSNTLQVGDPFGFPAVQFGYRAGTAGLGQAQFTFTAPTGGRTLAIAYNPPVYSTKGDVSFATPSSLPFYLAPGTWTLTDATVFDASGNAADYTGTKLASLFASNAFRVINRGPVDAEPPVLGAGHLLTPTVSLSAPNPALKATLKVTDIGTGVSEAVLFLSPPGQTYAEGQLSTIPLPVKSGTLTIYDTFFPGEPTGTWTFYQVLVCDVAQNCDVIKDRQAILNLLGANSVAVTN